MQNDEQITANWESLYETAILEHDRAYFLPKALEALDAISERLRQLRSGIYDSAERKALLDAHHNLENLLSQQANLPRIPFV